MTPEEKSKLKQAGFDPSQFEDSGGVDLSQYDLSKGEELPTESSIGGATYRAIKHQILPTLGSFAGAIPGQAVGTLGGPVGKVIGGIGGMLAGGVGAEKLQDILAPRSVAEQAQAELDAKEHPYVTAGAGLIPSLAFMRPSLSNIRGSATALNALRQGLAPTERNLAQLATTGGGAAVGGVTGVVDPLLHGESPTAGGIAESVALGSVLNSPTRLGAKFGMHAIPEAPSQNVSIPPELIRARDIADRNTRIMKAFSDQGVGDISAETPTEPSAVDALIAQRQDERFVAPTYKSQVPIDIQQPSPQAIDKNLGIDRNVYVDPATKKVVSAKDTKLADMAVVDKVIDEQIKKIAPYENPEKRTAQEVAPVIGEQAKPAGELTLEIKPQVREELTRQNTKFPLKDNKPQPGGLELGVRGKSAEEVSTPLKGSLETKGVYEIKPKVEEVANPELKTSAELAAEGKDSIGQGVKYAVDKNKELGGIPTQDLSKDTSIPKSLEEKRYIKSIASLDRMKASQSPTIRYVAGKVEKFHQAYGSLMGNYGNRYMMQMRDMLSGVKEHMLNNSPEMKNVYDHAIQMKEKGASNIALTPKENTIYQVFKDWYKATGEARNARKLLHHGELNPNGVPELMSSHAQSKFFGDISSTEGKKYFDDFVSHVEKIMMGRDETLTPELAKQKATNFVTDVRKGAAQAGGNIAEQFGALDKAEGFGLPDSMREKNLLTIMKRYSSRFARRVAYHDILETDPITRKALGLNNAKEEALSKDLKLPTGEAPEFVKTDALVKPVMDSVEGRYANPSVNFESLQGAVKSLMMGVGTGVRNLVSSHLISSSYILPTTQAKAFAHAWMNVLPAYKEMMLNGKGQLDIGNYEENRGMDTVNILHKFTDVVNRVGGRLLLENTSRAIDWDVAKIAAQDNLWNIRKGNRSYMRTKFMEQFAPKDWTSRIESGQFTPDDLNYIASRYVERIQGTYNTQGLPAEILNSPYAPLFSLARWSVERSNNFMQDVVNPTLNGHITPLLGTVGSMVLGGSALSLINEKLRGGKEKVPTFNELYQAHEDKGEIAAAMMYKMMSLAASAGHAGMLGDLARSTMEVMFGNKPQTTINNPLYQSIEQNSALFVDAAKALSEGDMHIGLDTLSEFLAANVQNYRLVLNNLGPDKTHDLELSNLNRDEKVYKQLHGEATSGTDLGKLNNPFANKLKKDFAQEQDLAKAAQMVSPLLQRAVTRGGNNPQQILRNLHSPAGSLTTSGFPSIETQRPELARYLDWQNRTQGSEKMKENFGTYLKEEELNKVKRRMVPHY